jgi:Na+/melibiose symporter-like transporter
MQLAYVLMWTVPFDKADENTNARSLYAFFTVCFYNVISSCYHVPYLALTMELSDDEAQRSVRRSGRRRSVVPHS